MRLLVYEYVSGGGAGEERILSDLLCEGFGMLRWLISDFKTAGHEVTTFLDSRLAVFNPPLIADNVIPVSSWQEAKAIIEKIAGAFDAAYVIGPEENQILQSLVRTIEKTALISLNCPASAIDEVANKMNLYKSLKQKGISVPKTMKFSISEKAETIERAINGNLDFPLVFKPLDGVGCSGLSLVHDNTQVAAAIANVEKKSAGQHFIIQEYINGTATSVSLIVAKNGACPISLNRQNLTIGDPEEASSYDGGLVPFDSPLKQEVYAVATKVAKSFKNLEGYIGIDFVLTEREPVVIEVNPRLTTSYVGLEQTVNFSIAQAIANAIMEKRIPENVQVHGYACFSKIKTLSPTVSALKNTYKIKDIVSPPFPLGELYTSALILRHSSTLNESIIRLNKTEKHFLRIMRGG